MWKLYQREYWQIDRDNRDEKLEERGNFSTRYLDGNLLDMVIDGTDKKYKDYSIDGRHLLINGNVVELGSRWMRITSESKERIQSLEDHLFILARMSKLFT